MAELFVQTPGRAKLDRFVTFTIDSPFLFETHSFFLATNDTDFHGLMYYLNQFAYYLKHIVT